MVISSCVMRSWVKDWANDQREMCSKHGGKTLMCACNTKTWKRGHKCNNFPTKGLRSVILKSVKKSATNVIKACYLKRFSQLKKWFHQWSNDGKRGCLRNRASRIMHRTQNIKTSTTEYNRFICNQELSLYSQNIVFGVDVVRLIGNAGKFHGICVINQGISH